MNRDNTYLKGNQHAKGNKPNQTSFKKGDKVWNKGLKGVMKPNSGSFKKGEKPINYLPIGTIKSREMTGHFAHPGWAAYNGENKEDNQFYSTPEGAVANLWLKLKLK